VADRVDPEGVITDGPYARVGRACAAVMRVGVLGPEILMVRHLDFWTLPGGGIEPGEQPAAAAVRELWEETGLRGKPARELFPGCWHVEIEKGARISIGADPELGADEQALRGVAWFTLDEKHDDRQVSKVIAAMGHLPMSQDAGSN